MVTCWQVAILTLARTTHETKLQGDDFNIKTQQFSGIINQRMVSFCDKPLTALSASFCKKVRVVRIRWHSKSGCQWPTRLSSSSLSTCKKMWSSTAISVYLVGLGLGWTWAWLDLYLVGLVLCWTWTWLDLVGLGLGWTWTLLDLDLDLVGLVLGWTWTWLDVWQTVFVQQNVLHRTQSVYPDVLVQPMVKTVDQI